MPTLTKGATARCLTVQSSQAFELACILAFAQACRYWQMMVLDRYVQTAAIASLHVLRAVIFVAAACVLLRRSRRTRSQAAGWFSGMAALVAGATLSLFGFMIQALPVTDIQTLLWANAIWPTAPLFLREPRLLGLCGCALVEVGSCLLVVRWLVRHAGDNRLPIVLAPRVLVITCLLCLCAYGLASTRDPRLFSMVLVLLVIQAFLGAGRGERQVLEEVPSAALTEDAGSICACTDGWLLELRSKQCLVGIAVMCSAFVGCWLPDQSRALLPAGVMLAACLLLVCDMAAGSRARDNVITIALPALVLGTVLSIVAQSPFNGIAACIVCGACAFMLPDVFLDPEQPVRGHGGSGAAHACQVLGKLSALMAGGMLAAWVLRPLGSVPATCFTAVMLGAMCAIYTRVVDVSGDVAGKKNETSADDADEHQVSAFDNENLRVRCGQIAREYDLTRRQEEVLFLLACGCTPSMVAERLVVSLDTIRTHIRLIHAKLGVHSTVDAVAIVLERHMSQRDGGI